METREELLNGLNYVKELISKIINVQQRQVKIVAQYREEEASISVAGVKNKGKMLMIVLLALINAFYLVIALAGGGFGFFIFYLILEGVLGLTWKKKSKLKIAALALLVIITVGTCILLFENMTTGIAEILIVLLVIVIAVIVYGIRWKNQQIDKKNALINDQNNELHKQYDVTVQQLKQLKQELFQNTSSWYPRNYYCLDAVDFFIHAVANYRADTVKEMVNLFESSEHQKRMEAGQRSINASLQQSLLNQEQIKQELKFANVLSIANLAMQSNTQAAIDRNTSAVNNTQRTVELAGNRVRDAIENLRR